MPTPAQPEMTSTETTTRYFTSYCGVRLPLKQVGELDAPTMSNRDTFFCGVFDGGGQLMSCEKRVHGELELHHAYGYHPSGQLARAEINYGSNEVTTIELPA